MIRGQVFPNHITSWKDLTQLFDPTLANRKVTVLADKHALREESARYKLVSGAENIGLKLDNRLFGDDL